MAGERVGPLDGESEIRAVECAYRASPFDAMLNLWLQSCLSPLSLYNNCLRNNSDLSVVYAHGISHDDSTPEPKTMMAGMKQQQEENGTHENRFIDGGN